MRCCPASTLVSLAYATLPAAARHLVTFSQRNDSPIPSLAGKSLTNLVPPSLRPSSRTLFPGIQTEYASRTSFGLEAIAGHKPLQHNAPEEGRRETLSKTPVWLHFVFMVVITERTSIQVPIWRASFAGNPWAWATLYDAYFGFLAFFCWVAWRERSLAIKIVWFILIMALGNIAMSFYVLLRLFALRPQDSVSALFQRKAA